MVEIFLITGVLLGPRHPPQPQLHHGAVQLGHLSTDISSPAAAEESDSILLSSRYSPSSRLVHYYRHPLLLDLTHEAADHPAGLHGAVEPGRLPHLLSPGHRDARARLLKLDRLNISKKLTKFPYKCQKIPLPHHFFKKIQDGRFPRDRKELGRIVFVLKRRTTNYCSLDIYSSTTDLALADFQF